MATLTVGFVASLLVTSALLPLVRRLLLSRSLLDHPNERSSHVIPTPRGAGLAQMAGIAGASIAGGGVPLGGILPALALGVLGAFDDWRTLSAGLRLSLQAVIAATAAAFLLVRPEAPWGFAWVALPVVVIVLVTTVNATNFMDGINGLSGAHGFVLGATYAALLHNAGNDAWSLLGVALAGASLAFLPWNWGNRARMFLGDSGSYLLGGVIGLLGLSVWQSTGSPLVAGFPFAIYAVDVFVTLARRALARQSLTQAHREHTYQRLVTAGWSHPRASIVVTGFSAAACLTAVGLEQGYLAPVAAIVIICALCAAYLLLPSLANRK